MKIRLVLAFYLAFLTVNVLAQSKPDVVILGSGNDQFNSLATLQSDIAASDRFNSVSTIDISTVIPTLEELQAFQAILWYATVTQFDGVALGNVIADYIDQGGGLIMSQFLFENSVAQFGRFSDDDYFPIHPGVFLQNDGPFGLGDVHEPNHPIFGGKAPVMDGGFSSFRTSSTAHPQATSIAKWNDPGGSILFTERIFASGAKILGYNLMVPYDPIIPGSGKKEDVLGLIIEGLAHISQQASDDPDITVEPLPVPEPPAVVVGDSSDTVFYVVNDGKADLTVNSVASSNPNFVFAVNSARFPTTLGQQDSATVTMIFRPVRGGVDSTVVTISSNDPDEGELQFMVRGRGLAPKITAAAERNFGAVIVADSASRNVRISNEGNADLVVTEITLSNPAFSYSLSPTTRLPHTIPPRSHDKFIDVNVKFKPDDSGDFFGQLFTTSNDPEQPVFITSLSGKGIRANLSREEVQNKVNAYIDTNVLNPAEAEAFLVQQPLQAGSTVRSFKSSEFNLVSSTLIWVAWVLETTGEMRFEQPGHVLVVDDSSGKVDAKPVNWWLLVDEQPWLSAVDERQFADERIRGTWPAPENDDSETLFSTTTETPAAPDSVCAVFVSGEGNSEIEQNAFDFDVELVQGNLVREVFGPRLPKGNTIVMNNPTADEVCLQLQSMNDKYKKIYFYYSGHGDTLGLTTRDQSLLYLSLARKLFETNAPEICVILDNCKSGTAKRKFKAYSAFKKRKITLMTSNRDTLVSYTRFIQNAGDDKPIYASNFTWQFIKCFGEPAADENGDSTTTLAESYRWLRTQNPDVYGVPMNDRMDPQICQNLVIEPDEEIISLPDQELWVRQIDGFESGATIRVETGATDMSGMYGEGIQGVWPTTQWTIETENQQEPFKVDLRFSYRQLNDDDIPQGTRLGIIRREDASMSWQEYMPIELDTERRIISGIGVTQFSDWAIAFIQDNTTAIDSDGLKSVPDKFVLQQNYPNPFNPSTVIRFVMPEAARVSVAIFDLRGRKLRDLLLDTLPAGEHSVRWDGRDGFGQRLPSGVYLTRMVAGEFTAMRKMMLVK